MEYLCDTRGTHLEHVWNTLEHTEHTWNTCGTHLEHNCNTVGAHLRHMWNTSTVHITTHVQGLGEPVHGTHLEHMWDTFGSQLNTIGTHLEHVWNTFGTRSQFTSQSTIWVLGNQFPRVAGELVPQATRSNSYLWKVRAPRQAWLRKTEVFA